MEASTVGILAAFGGGIISFLSPCVAPLMPGFLALISGSTTTEDESHNNGLFLTSVVFVTGFTIVFVALGASVSVFGDLFSDYRQQMAILAGVIMIAMGLVLLWGFRLPFLMSERRFHIEPKRFTYAETLLIGMAFGLGWTPCFGPILASILALSSTVDGVQQGTVLLTAYSIGLGVPFLLLGLSLSRFQRLLRSFTRHMSAVVAVSGIVLILVGALFVSGQVFQLSIQAQRFMDGIPGLTLG